MKNWITRKCERFVGSLCGIVHHVELATGRFKRRLSLREWTSNTSPLHGVSWVQVPNSRNWSRLPRLIRARCITCPMNCWALLYSSATVHQYRICLDETMGCNFIKPEAKEDTASDDQGDAEQVRLEHSSGKMLATNFVLQLSSFSPRSASSKSGETVQSVGFPIISNSIVNKPIIILEITRFGRWFYIRPSLGISFLYNMSAS